MQTVHCLWVSSPVRRTRLIPIRNSVHRMAWHGLQMLCLLFLVVPVPPSSGFVNSEKFSSGCTSLFPLGKPRV